MKKKTVYLCHTCKSMRPFKIVINSGVNSMFTIPTSTQYTYDYDINVPAMGTRLFNQTGNVTLLFDNANTNYEIWISGVFPHWYQNNNSERLQVLDVKQWGDIEWKSMSRSFYGCSNLQVSATDTPDVSSVTNMEWMFTNCQSLTELDVSNWDVSSVTDMGQMFYSCTSLTTLDVSNWNVSSVTNMSNMFRSCTSLTTLDVSNWDVSSVTSMSYMFYSCTSLTALDVSNWNVSSVTNMSNMFYSCTSLTALDVSNWNVSSVTSMSYFIGETHSLVSDVSNWDLSNVPNLSHFKRHQHPGTSSLTTDIVNLTTSSATNIVGIFRYNKSDKIELDCTSVEYIDIYSFQSGYTTKLILHNLKISFSITSTANVLGIAIDDLAISVADMTGQPSPSVTMTTAQRNSGIDETLWTDKNWTIVEV